MSVRRFKSPRVAGMEERPLALSKMEEGSGDSDSELSNKSDPEEEEINIPSIELEADIFGLSICSLMRDFHFIARHKGSPISRYVRVAVTLSLLFVCIGVQIFLLQAFKHLVTAKAVHDIRGAYDVFEKAMYNETTLTVNGNHRGLGTFYPERFSSLSDDEQDAVCHIPLSQPEFFVVILSVWTLTCFLQLHRCQQDFRSLVFNTKHCASMRDSVQDLDGDLGEVVLVSHLTYGMKAFVTIAVLIPRCLITCYLLWVGCRWLLATNDFSDLFLNALALEFVFLLKDSLYICLVSERSQRDLANTKINPPSHTEKAGLCKFTGTLLWLIYTIAWVLLYMGIPHHTDGLQSVLPGYKWDVQTVCTRWIDWRYCVEASCRSDPTRLEA